MMHLLLSSVACKCFFLKHFWKIQLAARKTELIYSYESGIPCERKLGSIREYFALSNYSIYFPCFQNIQFFGNLTTQISCSSDSFTLHVVILLPHSSAGIGLGRGHDLRKVCEDRQPKLYNGVGGEYFKRGQEY